MTDNGPTLAEAYRIVRALIDGENEAGTEGTAYLDTDQIAAIEEVLALTQDVLREAGEEV